MKEIKEAIEHGTPEVPEHFKGVDFSDVILRLGQQASTEKMNSAVKAVETLSTHLHEYGDFLANG